MTLGRSSALNKTQGERASRVAHSTAEKRLYAEGKQAESTASDTYNAQI